MTPAAGAGVSVSRKARAGGCCCGAVIKYWKKLAFVTTLDYTTKYKKELQELQLLQLCSIVLSPLDL